MKHVLVSLLLGLNLAVHAKVGAGILLIDNSLPDGPKVLLLQRRSENHDRCWDVPGGAFMSPNHNPHSDSTVNDPVVSVEAVI